MTASDLPHPGTTLAVLIAATRFPRMRGYAAADAQNASFGRSVAAFRRYLTDCLALPADRVLSLVDDAREPAALLAAVRDFLKEQRRLSPVRDVVVFFCGHGAELEGQYRLVLCGTDEALLRSSTLELREFVALLAREVTDCRTYLLLDCCYAARAVVPLQNVVWRSPVGSSGGVVLLAACGAQEEALTPVDGQLTQFTGALLEVLAAPEGSASPEPRLSLRDIAQGVQAAVAGLGKQARIPHLLEKDPALRLADVPLWGPSSVALPPAPTWWKRVRHRLARGVHRPSLALLAGIAVPLLLVLAYAFWPQIACCFDPPPPFDQTPDFSALMPPADELNKPRGESDLQPQDVEVWFVNATPRPLELLAVGCESQRRSVNERIDPFVAGAVSRELRVTLEPDRPVKLARFTYGRGWYILFVYDPCLGWLPYAENGQPIGRRNLFTHRRQTVTLTRGRDDRFPYVWTFTPDAVPSEATDAP